MVKIRLRFLLLEFLRILICKKSDFRICQVSQWKVETFSKSCFCMMGIHSSIFRHEITSAVIGLFLRMKKKSCANIGNVQIFKLTFFYNMIFRNLSGFRNVSPALRSWNKQIYLWFYDINSVKWCWSVKSVDSGFVRFVKYKTTGQTVSLWIFFFVFMLLKDNKILSKFSLSLKKLNFGKCGKYPNRSTWQTHKENRKTCAIVFDAVWYFIWDFFFVILHECLWLNFVSDKKN